jgi:hypothetical protein
MEQKKTENKYKKEVLIFLIKKYQDEIEEIEKIEKETQFLNRRLANTKEALKQKIKIIKRSLEMLENIGCIVFSLVEGIYKENKSVKPVWVKQVFIDYNKILKK